MFCVLNYFILYFEKKWIDAAQFLEIELQKPFLEAQNEIVNGSRKDYPSNGINFASAGSGVLPATNQDLVCYYHLFIYL